MSADLSTTIAARKARFRAQFGAYRAALSEAEYEERSRAIVRRLEAMPEIQSAQTVHVYWPLVRRREVDVRPLIERLHARGTTVYLPIVQSTDQSAPPVLAHGLFRGADRLTTTRWGLKEPEEALPDTPSSADAVIVPAFGVGRNGHRIGHGFGYYDRFLSLMKGVRICPTFDACLVDVVPCESHDVPIDVIVTESTVLRRDAM